jgi:hypothetical protein
MPTVVFSFLTGRNIRSAEMAKSFFESVKADLNCASLGDFGDVEPLAQTFEGDADVACRLWGRILFWNESRTNGFGAVLHGTARRHTNVSFHFDTSFGPIRSQVIALVGQ